MLDSGQSSRSSTTITVVTAALMMLGVVMVFSATANLSGPGPLERSIHHPAVRQSMFTAAAFGALLVMSALSYEFWRWRRSWIWQPAAWLFVAAIGLCAVALVPGIGTVRKGAQRWLTVGPSAWGIGLQPSEIAKLAIVVFLASYAAWRGDRMRSFFLGLLPALVLLAGTVGVVGVEDFGTAALIGVVGVGVLYAGGARLWHLVLLSIPGLVGMGAMIWSEPYRIQRLFTFRHYWDDPQGAGYHQVQSLVTIASGGWWGLGLGNGIQKYGYLPEDHSDFIFAVICEELGIVGAVGVMALYVVLVWHGRRAMRDAPNMLGRLLAFGAVAMVGIQAILNIAVVTVSVPTKGIALPLVSAGGSSVVFLGALLGVLVNVSRRRPRTADGAAELPGAEIAPIMAG